MRYWGDIELLDEDELVRLEDFVDLRQINAAPQADREPPNKKKGTRLCALLPLRPLRLCN